MEIHWITPHPVPSHHQENDFFLKLRGHLCKPAFAAGIWGEVVDPRNTSSNQSRPSSYICFPLERDPRGKMSGLSLGLNAEMQRCTNSEFFQSSCIVCLTFRCICEVFAVKQIHKWYSSSHHRSRKWPRCKFSFKLEKFSTSLRKKRGIPKISPTQNTPPQKMSCWRVATNAASSFWKEIH